MFLIFATLNGHPVGPTQMVPPIESTCRQELSTIKGINQYNDLQHNGIVYYGSCESVKD